MADPVFEVGERVIVPTFGGGTVKFYGTAQFAPGTWVGIRLDGPAGKNNGSVKDVKYFDCEPNHGLFVKASQLQKSGPSAPSSPAPAKPAAAPATPSTPAAVAAKPPATPAAPAAKPPATPTRAVELEAPAAGTPPKTPLKPAGAPTAVATPPATPSAPATPSTPAKPPATPSAAPPSLPKGAPAAGAPPPLPSGGPPPLPPSTAKGGPPPLPASAPSSLSADLQRMLAELKELTEWRERANENMKGLQKQLAAANTRGDQLAAELDKEKKERERALEKVAKDAGKEKEKQVKEWEREKAELEEKVSDLTEQLELATLDHQIAKERADGLEKELEALKGQVDILESQQAKTSTSAAALEAKTDTERALVVQVEKLKEALLKLRDLSVVEKHESEKKIADLEKRLEHSRVVEEKLSKAEAVLKKKDATIEELQQQVDEASDAQKMVEELTDKNLNLEERVDELKASVQELEELRDMSEELEENQAIVEKKLRSETYAKEIQILDLNTTLQTARTEAEELRQQLEQYRLKLRNLERDLGELRKREDERSEQTEQLSEQSQQLLAQNIQLKNKAQKGVALEIENELKTLSVHQSLAHLSYLKAFLADDSFHADERAIEVLLSFERIASKCSIVAHQASAHYRLSKIATPADPLNPSKFTEEEIAFAIELVQAMHRISFASSSLSAALHKADVETFLKIGQLGAEVKPAEQKLDQLIKLIARDDLTEAYPLAALVTGFDAMEQAVRSKLKAQSLTGGAIGTAVYAHSAADLLESISLLSVLVRMLHKLAGAPHKDDADEAIGKEISDVCRVIIKLLTGTQLSLNEHIREKFQSASAGLNSLLVLLRQLGEDMRSRVGAAADQLAAEHRGRIFAEALQARCQADQIGGQGQQMTLHDVIKQRLAPLYSYAYEASEQISAAIAVQQTVTEADVPPPWKARADAFRATVSAAPHLRTQLERLQAELAQQQADIRLKEHALVEAARKEQVLDTRLQSIAKRNDELSAAAAETTTAHSRQLKMYEDALEALRKEVASLEAEGRDLRLAHSQLVAKQTESASETRSMPQISSEELSAEVRSLRSTVRALLSRLRTERANRTGDIQPLEPLNVQTPAQRAAAAAPRERINRILVDSMRVLASAQVVNLKEGTAKWERECTLRRDRLRQLQQQLNETKLSEMKKAPVNTEPAAQTLRDTKGQVLVAKIAVPGATGGTVKLSLPPQELKRIHSLFVN